MGTRQELKVAYRLATYERPLRSTASSIAGRFHRQGQDEPTQYACLHPLGPWAEFARAKNIDDADKLRTVSQRVWALRVDVEPLVHVTFENAESLGLTAAQLVSADHRHCQRFAERLRTEGARGLVVPSAALPGTENVVLFGWRASAPNLIDPVDLVDVPASVTADRAAAPPALIDVARFRKDRSHAGIAAAARGERFEFREPQLD